MRAPQGGWGLQALHDSHLRKILALYMLMIYILRPMDLLERLRCCKGFDWDDGNSGKNLEKHGVTDGETEQVFFNQPLVASVDVQHSTEEERLHLLGQTDAGRRLFLLCTIRGNLIRVISARPMNRKEREAYQSNEQEA